MDSSDLTADLSDAEISTTQESEEIQPPVLSSHSLSMGENRGLSASQPILSSQPTDSSKNRKSGSQTNVKPNERFPYLKVQEDNEVLQARVIELGLALRDAKTRQRFAEEQLAKPVQEVVEDYCNLQRIIRDGQDKVKDYDNLLEKHNKLQEENVKLQRYVNETVKSYVQKLTEKDEEMDRMRREYLAGEEFTLRSEPDAEPANKIISIELNQQKILNDDYLKKISQLESELAMTRQRLVDIETATKENTIGEIEDGISRTLVLSERERELSHRVDDLLLENKEWKDRYISCNDCLIQYMNKLNSMEKKLMDAGLSSTQLNLSNNFDVRDNARVINLLEKMKTELLSERDKNKNLRQEVNKLMGKDDSVLSETSVENATEAIEDMKEEVDEEKVLILAEAAAVMENLKKRGWLDTTQNESLDVCESFANVPPIDLGIKDSEILKKFDRSFVPETMEHVSLLNTSMGQFLQTSMNAAADMASLKDNLGDFRHVLASMFERLKGCAALFDEIRLILSNGEHNPLADRIREMQIVWDTAKEQADQITKAVDSAERSIIGLQAHISVLEQSVLQTSFVLDHTRRMTVTNEKSMISFLAQGESSMLVQENHKAEVDELTSELKEVVHSRDAAFSRIELLEKQLRIVELSESDAQMKCEQLMEEKERLIIEIERLNDSLTTTASDLEHVKSMLRKANQRLEVADENNINQTSEIATLKSAVDALEATRDDLCKRVTDYSQDIQAINEICARKEEERTSAVAKFTELNKTIEELQITLESARVTINQKMNEYHELKKHSDAMKDQLSRQLEASRSNAEVLQSQLSELLFNKQKDVKTNSTWSSADNMPSPNSSLLYKSTMAQKGSQTKLSHDEISAIESELSRVCADLQTLLNVYNQLESVLYPFLFSNTSAFQGSRDVATAQRNYDKLVRAVREKSTWEAKTKEQVEKLEKELHNRGDTHSGKTKIVTFKKTPIDAEYKDKLRQDIFSALSMMMDLTYNLKSAEAGYKSGYKFDLAPLVDDARQIRTILDDMRKNSTYDKENMPQDMSECHALIIRLNLDNKYLYKRLTELEKNYELLDKKYKEIKEDVRKGEDPNNPIIVNKIDTEMSKIESELGKVHQVLKKMQEPRNTRVKKQ